ncbi:MAG: transposase [Parcubacteria group bacterium]
MENIKRKHSADFKTKIAMELIRGSDTMTAICSRNSIHPTQARKWKEQALLGMQSQFLKTGRTDELKEKNELINELYQQIGQLKVELDWLKKKSETI